MMLCKKQESQVYTQILSDMAHFRKINDNKKKLAEISDLNNFTGGPRDKVYERKFRMEEIIEDRAQTSEPKGMKYLHLGIKRMINNKTCKKMKTTTKTQLMQAIAE